jgi:organic hydroperoxide reductase OsmC/OhrA
MEKITVAEPKKTYKTFHYQTELKWVGHRAGMIGSYGKPEFRVASPPEFQGEAGVWTPEDLFVASVEACTMTTFIAFAERKKLPIVSYASYAEGVLENIRGNYQFTKIILKPTIVIAKDEDRESAETTLHQAHSACFIANSVLSEVFLEPKFEIAS